MVKYMVPGFNRVFDSLEELAYNPASCDEECKFCPVSSTNNQTKEYCIDYAVSHPEDYIKKRGIIVLKTEDEWNKEPAPDVFSMTKDEWAMAKAMFSSINQNFAFYRDESNKLSWNSLDYLIDCGFCNDHLLPYKIMLWLKPGHKISYEEMVEAAIQLWGENN